MERNSFVKMHGLGNEYIVLDSTNIDFRLTKQAIRRLCNIHFGIGSDGIVMKVPSAKADFGFRVYNPDGSEAEKSGNGLRIFCKYLYDYGYTKSRQFSVETLTDIVYADIVKEEKGKAMLIMVEMGKAIFTSGDFPVGPDKQEFIAQKIMAGDREYEVNCVSVGNPHCVVIKQDLDEEEVRKYGPLLENHPLFPNRINVQFAKVLSDHDAQILIWERGAGYTLASGSSSCAASSVLVKRGLIKGDLTMHMQGGILKIQIDPEWNIRMTGEVREIVRGVLGNELLEDLSKSFAC
ncbi:MAG: diaminopimelate epimerase [Bacteroidetes bacterium GWE2_41_25]|nr:MAG: diaminopimelate epimerase [Bacteroidetes bacterium GWA2_40_15]OFX90886.1 MAG: diaminopimelate epimerase [Bacteroidetes bacterium GWE2_41_25]OFX94475.1 MAG: diaminopimelate epimerase [Bacteroidetes bacterium GWC2_40_22]OFY60525.1 MAG: diaminopimelate epimerase [Bacteroidetes bacterium GWF2_41_9]HBH82435.1 diaminopimelate epimerase [Bacteroidales bacterium]